MANDIAQRAQEALRRMMGEQQTEETPFNTGATRTADQTDEIQATWDPQGKSHLGYQKMLADKAAAAAAAEKARQDAATAAQQQAAQAAAAGQASAAAQTAAVSAAPAAQQALYGYITPRKTYASYYAGNQDALSRSSYQGQGTQNGVGQNWGKVGNPYQFRNQYNQYLQDTLKQEAGKIASSGGTLSYDQYYAGNEDAATYRHYGSGSVNSGANQNWGSVGNPYRFSNDYNKYLDSKGYRMGQYDPLYTKLGTANTGFKAISYI